MEEDGFYKRMRNGILIGISGKARSGKDTLANMIREEDPSFTILHFSDAVKQTAETLFDWQGYKGDEWRCGHCGFVYAVIGSEDKCPNCNSDVTAIYPFGRKLLIDIGLSMRDIWQDVWLHRTLSRLDPNRNYIIADVRFLNEYNAIKDMGGVVIRIERPSRIKTIYDNSISETELDSVSYGLTALNNGDLNFLKETASTTLKAIRVMLHA